MVPEIWPIETFKGKFDHDLISQHHPRSNQFFVTELPIDVSGLIRCDKLYCFEATFVNKIGWMDCILVHSPSFSLYMLGYLFPCA